MEALEAQLDVVLDAFLLLSLGRSAAITPHPTCVHHRCCSLLVQCLQYRLPAGTQHSLPAPSVALFCAHWSTLHREVRGSHSVKMR